MRRGTDEEPAAHNRRIQGHQFQWQWTVVYLSAIVFLQTSDQLSVAPKRHPRK